MPQKDDFFSQFKEVPDDEFFGALPDAIPPSTTVTEPSKPKDKYSGILTGDHPFIEFLPKKAENKVEPHEMRMFTGYEPFFDNVRNKIADFAGQLPDGINKPVAQWGSVAADAGKFGMDVLSDPFSALGLGKIRDAIGMGHATSELPSIKPVARPIESVGESIANDIPLSPEQYHVSPSSEVNVTVGGRSQTLPSEASAPTEVAPRFNRRGETGNTGTIQAASNPDTIYLKMPTPENVKKAREAGYVFEGLDSNGRFKMRKTGESNQMPVLESEVGNTRPTKSGVKENELADAPSDGHIGTMLDTKKGSKLEEAYNFPRAVMASVDMSAPLRQGLGLIHKKEFWNSLSGMFKAWGSEDAFRAIQSNIAERPLFRPRVGKGNTILPSFAEDAGLKLGDLTNLNNREEMLMSTWAEKVPGVRRSNRAYTAFLNKLRADTFENLVGDFNVINPAGKNDLATARSLAEFVNTATGRGSLHKLEPAAKILNGAFFSPRLIASRLNMLGQGANAAFRPSTYLSSAPNVRREYLKSMTTLFGAGNAMLQLAKAAGAEVSYDPRSSDFGKIKIGNTRIDVWGGYQQYMVLLAKLATKQAVSASNPDKVTNLGEEFGRDTRLSVAGRFVEQKLHPVLNFATGWLRGKDAIGQPFNVPEEVAQRFIPIFLQDFKEMLTENPNLLPWAEDAYSEIHPENLPMLAPDLFGMGTQNFSR